MRQGAKMTALTPQPFATSEKTTKSAAEQSPIFVGPKNSGLAPQPFKTFFFNPP